MGKVPENWVRTSYGERGQCGGQNGSYWMCCIARKNKRNKKKGIQF